ncbi:MAG TPA: lytic transglycosylase domain-containing protein [Nocardioides sp.]|uniref:aggregation-promoting factor C-terminal-like domain-containing protein n=1 Tax=Nocardioides sp. TaxID=35761 RepID=UPI002E329E07|nr:lytic transglycosylase domain-containing protein [Nocardioides sp.]HEX5089808.1 lytic transglycosylase domain-containing protein [Nocardioides sp.]
MSSHQPQAGKHRASRARRAPKAALKTSLTLSSMAVVATGFAVGSGSLTLSPHAGPATSTTSAVADLGAQAEAAISGASISDSAQAEDDAAAAATHRSEAPVTRSDSRAAADPLKKHTLSLGSGNTMSRTEDLSDESPQDIARALLATYGWSQDQFGCLDSLWMRESHWNVHAANPSGAYGIPQALPGSKMASAGDDWRDNAVTQIKWGLGYIADRYGSPCGAWAHSQGHGWY